MKKHILLIQFFTFIGISWSIPVNASHLDGLWRNDRLQITLRIEQEDDGFRAKRTDEGIWYHYSSQDNRYYLDKRGNWYEVIDNDELLWNEVDSDKRIKFTRIDDRDSYQWNTPANGFNPYDNRYRNGDRNDWDDYRFDHTFSRLEGNWHQRNGRDDLQIACFNGGIKVNSKHNGWEKFYADRSGNRFRDNEGNTIILLDYETLRFRNDHGRCEEIYTRQRNWDRDRHEWRD